jgi:uncharacterized protein (DUF58 family)
MAKPKVTNTFKLKGGAYTDIRELIQLRYAARDMDVLQANKTRNPLSGLLSSKFRGRGIDFAEVRIYQPGDDVRTIDWRVTARTQIPHTKLFQEEKERPVLILVDQSASMFFGSRQAFKSVLAAESAALIAWTALERGDRVGGIVFSENGHREVRPRRSKTSVLRLLHEVDDYNRALTKQANLGAQTYLADALRNVRRVAKHGSTILIISDFLALNEEAKIHLRQLARQDDVIGVHISDPLERELPRPDLYTITDGNNRSRINTSVQRHRRAYEKQYQDSLEQVRAEFKRVKSPLVELSTSQGLVSQLSAQFNHGAFANG